MAEFTSAEKVNIGYENEYSTDAGSSAIIRFGSFSMIRYIV